jgi:hypothetical protein
MKRCPKCGQSKPLDGFGVRKRSPTGRKSWCRRCEAARQVQRCRERRTAGLCVACGHRSKAEGRTLCTECLAGRATRRAFRRAAGRCAGCAAVALAGRTHCGSCLTKAWIHRLTKRRGISEPEYLARLERQGRRCAICGKGCGTGRRLAVDHDHATGRVRGLLCFRCNTSLARYEEFAAEFAEYLRGATIGVATP